MKIIHKLVLAVALPVSLVWVVGYFATNAGEESLQNAIEQNSVARARAVMDELDRTIHIRIDEWIAYSKDSTVQHSLRASNEEFEQIGDPQALIDNRDMAWMEFPPDTLSQLMRALTTNKLAVELQRKTNYTDEEYESPVFPEVFVTNRFGANIAQTNRTSDYRQDDEEWWQRARRDGLYVSDLGYDASAGMSSIDICVRVNDEEGGFIGVIKAVLNIKEALGALQARTIGHDAEDSIQLTLFTAEQQIVLTTRPQLIPFADGSHIFDESGIEVRRLDDHPAELYSSDANLRSYRDHDVITLIRPCECEPDKRLLSTFVTSRGNGDFKGLGWILLLDRDADQVFHPIAVLKNDILVACFMGTPIVLLIGGLMAVPISKRIGRLEAAAAAISRGEPDARIDIGGHDELTRLADAFNQMVIDVNAAHEKAHEKAQLLATRNDELIEEIEKRQRIKKQIEILSRFPEENPNPVLRIENDGTIVYANCASDPLLAEWGVSVGEVLPEPWLHFHREACITGTPIESELECEQWTFMCSISGPIDADYTYLYGRDITERQRAEKALRESESRVRAIIDCAPDCIISIDQEGRILEFNPAAERVFGHARADVVQKELCEVIIPQSLRERHRNGLARYLSTGESSVLGELIEISAVRADGSELPVELAITAIDNDDRPSFIAIIRDITQRKKTEQVQARLKAAIEAATDSVVITDTKGVVQYVNPAFERITGYSCEETIGTNPKAYSSGKHDKAFYDNLWQTISAGNIWSGSFINKRKDGTLFHEEATISPVRDTSGQIVSYVAVKRDVSHERQMEVQLHHAQKLESIGQLAAGIAHEINTPTQYVGDNTRFLRDSINDLMLLIKRCGEILDPDGQPLSWQERVAAFQAAIKEFDLEFLQDEIPQAIEQTLSGVDRVAEIVRAMKDFSHPGSEEKTPTDLNKAIESTITVCRNRWKYVADLETNFEDGLPTTPCLVGEFNQVILNIIVNAADAIGGVVGDGSEGKGRITVSTRQDGEFAEIRVSDTGGGIPEEIQHKVFDPFFTTKEVGKGTGQGLAISHDVIVNKHSGTIKIEVEPDVGTTFIIRLPIAQQTVEGHKEAA